MISINTTLIVQVIHFLILVFILNRIMIQPIMRLIDDRKEYVEKIQGEILELEQETERLKKEFVSVQANARKEALLKREEIRSQAFGKVDEYLRESQEKVTSIRAKADSEAEREVKEMQPLLSNEAASLAEEIMIKVMGRRSAG
ncbi:MAG: hypothetical protein JRH13_01390 [Deltaproteobacteria bacterium]|nr:hypothetical protein [Deltaproteobacteria bacterium]MBW2015374.1 hypothetical protein [Deltaproteobacteria bacterium]MBW2128002.1 hypothetical protein [Deltaproteobacteria bacterium]MBW2302581.1 hypothetical protein [Deltaproteobacteria bacterium]